MRLSRLPGTPLLSVVSCHTHPLQAGKAQLTNLKTVFSACMETAVSCLTQEKEVRRIERTCLLFAHTPNQNALLMALVREIRLCTNLVVQYKQNIFDTATMGIVVKVRSCHQPKLP